MTIGSIGRDASIPAGTSRTHDVKQETPFANVQASVLKARTAEKGDVATAVTSEEREYFQELFPSATAEIKAYPTYSPRGMQKATVSGTMFDRKG